MSSTCCKCRNIGKTDKAFRIFIGFLLMAHGIYFNNAVLVAISFIPLTTALLRICPLYYLLKISTTGEKSSSCCCSTEEKETSNNAPSDKQETA